MPAHKKAKRRPQQGAPPRWHVERFAIARAQGMSLIEAVAKAGRSSDGTGDVAARKAGARMEKHPEVQVAIQRCKRDLIREAGKKKIAELWPDALHVIETLLHDPELNHANQIKLVELVARMTGHLNNDTGVSVQVVQIGAQAREEIRLLQSDGDAQRVALDELERMTIGGSSGSSVSLEIGEAV